MELFEGFGYMVKFLLCCIPGILVFWGICNMYESAVVRRFHACSKVPYPDDANASAAEISAFLKNEMRKRDLDNAEGLNVASLDNEIADRILCDVHENFKHFVKYIHVMGCELVIEKVSNNDIEEERASKQMRNRK